MIRFAETPADYDAFAAICREYVAWCRERYSAMPDFVEEVFGYQSLDAELAALSVKYGPPNGRVVLALRGDDVVAGGAYRRLSHTDCELKRLYVRQGAQGAGLGRAISEALFAAAKRDGYSTVKLDTGQLMQEAQAMYATMGFDRIAPYQTYPDHLMSHLVFMQKRL